MKFAIRWSLYFVCMAAILVGCASESDLEPLVIEITATPEGETVALQPTLTPSISPIPPSATPSPLPSDTPPQAFPTATNTPTIEGVASPTPFLTATSSPTSPAFPTSTLASPTSFPSLTPTEGGAGQSTVDGITVPTDSFAPFPTSTAASLTPLPTDPNQPQPTEPSGLIVPRAVSELAPPPDQLPILNAAKIGVQLHPFVTDEAWNNALSLAEQLEMEWIKFQIPWEVVEPAPGVYDMQYDRMVLLVANAHRRGLKVLISVNRAPAWARPADADLNNFSPPADPNALAAFITQLMTDIGPQFMEAIEIWNEPNLRREWGDYPMTGAEYMRYFEPAYRAAKAADPDVIVVTAALAPAGTVGDAAADDREFLRQMYAAGLGNFPDAKLGVHPYGWANPPAAQCCSTDPWADAPQFFMRDTIEDYRAISLANSDPGRQMWITEMGWGTFDAIRADGGDAVPPQGAEFMQFVTIEEQARYMVDALDILQSPPYDDYVELKFLWNMNFATIEGAIDDGIEQVGYSFLDEAGRPRLVFYYLLNTRKFYEGVLP